MSGSVWQVPLRVDMTLYTAQQRVNIASHEGASRHGFVHKACHKAGAQFTEGLTVPMPEQEAQMLGYQTV